MNHRESKENRSDLWAQLAPLMSDAADKLESFRRPGGANSRLAHWEPAEPTLRWFKSYLQLAAQSTPPHELDLIRSIENIGLGDPVTIKVRCTTSGQAGVEELAVNLDYLYAAEEIAFIEGVIASSELRSVCELGAGFGRTAHAVLETMPSIQTYWIVDLFETLQLSSAYLRAVLNDALWAKLRFVDATQRELYPNECDLVMQIDGFQEMDYSTIDWYFESLVSCGRAFYCSNPVGKYLPQVAGIDSINPDGGAMLLGRSRSLVDPWDETSLSAARLGHENAYCPAGFVVAESSPSRLRAFYQHVLYQRSGTQQYVS
jgi:putative sugar O-methyltransferase